MSLPRRILHALHIACSFIIVLFFITGYLLQHDDIISLDFHKSGAKVRRNFEIRKDADRAGQNLICNCLTDRDIGS